MRLTVLGCFGPYPPPRGATSGYLDEAGGARFAMDLGTGCLAALTALTEPADLDAVILSHWHYDHCCDLLPLIYRLGALGRTLTVYGPEDPAQPVYQACAAAPVIPFIIGIPPFLFFNTLDPATVILYRAKLKQTLKSD